MCHFFGGWCKARHQRHSGKGARQDRNAYGVCLLSHCQAACLHVQTIHYIMHDHISCMSQTAASRRPHRPRCPEIRKIYKFAGLPLPGLGFMMRAFVVRQVSVDLWEQVHHTVLGKILTQMMIPAARPQAFLTVCLGCIQQDACKVLSMVDSDSGLWVCRFFGRKTKMTL